MRWLALLHRWAGGITGLLLAVIGLSGTVLVWEESWIALPGADDPLNSEPAAIAGAVTAALAENRPLGRITFADEGMALHQAVFRDGGGAYLTQGGEVVDRWDSLWGRPELWLFDLHHYLLVGENGKYLTGGLGLLLAAFAVSGLVLWWRTRRTFKLRAWPSRFTRSAIVRHHRDIGVVASPLLLLTALTGAFMVFPALSDFMLSPWAEPATEEVPSLSPRTDGAPTDWRAAMANAQAAFPAARPRRLMFPAAPGAPLVLRMKQDFEWTPNGRTYVYLDPASAAVIGTDDPAEGDTASAISETFYPVHAGKVGGAAWRLLLTLCGLALVMLGTFATWSFWFGKPARPVAAK